MRIENPNVYKIKGPRKRLVVEFVTDPTQGAWHSPEDLMRWIAQHSYVVAVEAAPASGS